MFDIKKFYLSDKTIFHKIDGSLKLIFALLWAIIVFSFNDLRVFIFFFLLGLLLVILAKTPAKIIIGFFTVLFIFTFFNSIFLLLVTPQYGSELTGTYTDAIDVGYAVITYETIWYALTLSFKYLALSPITLLFVLTTHPTKFAVSLNKLKINYKIAYSVNLALRYIPSIFTEFTTIKYAQQMKGIEFDFRNPFKALKNYLFILMPLIKNSIRKVDIVSDGMDLRNFGMKNRRTWIHYEPYSKLDYSVMILLAIMIIVIITIFLFLNREFYYPF